MRETEGELRLLQTALDQSARRAGPHLRSIFGSEHRLSAKQVLVHLEGVKQVALTTMSSSGAPRVAPVDTIFLHGRFYVSTDEKSYRAKHLRRRPSLASRTSRRLSW